MRAQAHPLLLRFGRFLLVGALATGTQYVVLLVGVEAFAAAATTASNVGFVFSALLNYRLNYSYTFSSTVPHGLASRRFAVVATCGLAINAALMWLLSGPAHWPYLAAQVVATLAVLIWNFLGSLLWSFASTGLPRRSE